MRQVRAQDDLRSRLACPNCYGELAWYPNEAVCGCGRAFPIVDDVLCIEGGDDTQRSYFQNAWQGSRPEGVPSATRHRLRFVPFQGEECRILEIGAGNASLAKHYSMLDIMSTDLVLHGIRDLGARAVVSPLPKLPFQSGTFDLVIAFEVLEHLNQSDLKPTIDSVRRVLRPGGTFALSVPAWPLSAIERILRAIRHLCWPRLENLGDWDFPHEARFSPGELERSLDGFDVITSKRWCRSASAISGYALNPILRRLGLPEIDLEALDALVPFDAGSNLVVVASKIGT